MSLTLDETIEKDPLVELGQRFRDHPKFPNMALHYFQHLLTWRAGPRLLNKVAGNYIRLQIVGYVLYLHYATDPTDPDAGPTYLKLLDLCQRRNQCSSRVLITVLALLRLAGFVTVSRGVKDQRLKLFRPTEKLISFVRDWYVHTLGCFDILDPQLQLAHRVGTEPAFLGQFFVNYGGPYLEHNILMGEYYPEILALLKLDCGFPVIGSLTEATLASREIPSPAKIAERFAASLSQVRSVVRLAAKMNLIRLSETGKIEDASAITSLMQDFIARELAFYAKYGLGLEHRLPLD